jgi:hypothetical protein
VAAVQVHLRNLDLLRRQVGGQSAADDLTAEDVRHHDQDVVRAEQQAGDESPRREHERARGGEVIDQVDVQPGAQVAARSDRGEGEQVGLEQRDERAD